MGLFGGRSAACGAALVALAEDFLDGRIDGPTFRRDILAVRRRSSNRSLGRYRRTVDSIVLSVGALTSRPPTHETTSRFADIDEERLREEVAAVLARDGIRPSDITVPDHLLDPFSVALRDLVDAIRTEHEGRVRITVEDDEVTLRPRDGNGIAISWDDYSENLVAVDVGDHSFTLHRHPDQAEYLRDIVDAAVAGRIVELHGLGRTRLVIPRRDGTTVHETGHRFPLGLVPLPGWPERASSTTFAPYPPVQDPTSTIEG